MVYFNHILAYICMSTFPSHWHVNSTFWMDEGLLSISLACCGQLVKIRITLEPYGIFKFNFSKPMWAHKTGRSVYALYARGVGCSAPTSELKIVVVNST